MLWLVLYLSTLINISNCSNVLTVLKKSHFHVFIVPLCCRYGIYFELFIMTVDTLMFYLLTLQVVYFIYAQSFAVW